MVFPSIHFKEDMLCCLYASSFSFIIQFDVRFTKGQQTTYYYFAALLVNFERSDHDTTFKSKQKIVFVVYLMLTKYELLPVYYLSL